MPESTTYVARSHVEQLAENNFALWDTLIGQSLLVQDFLVLCLSDANAARRRYEETAELRRRVSDLEGQLEVSAQERRSKQNLDRVHLGSTSRRGVKMLAHRRPPIVAGESSSVPMTECREEDEDEVGDWLVSSEDVSSRPPGGGGYA